MAPAMKFCNGAEPSIRRASEAFFQVVESDPTFLALIIDPCSQSGFQILVFLGARCNQHGQQFPALGSRKGQCHPGDFFEGHGFDLTAVAWKSNSLGEPDKSTLQRTIGSMGSFADIM
jgi:hypothetical protein